MTLITDEYRAQQAAMHAMPRGYGGRNMETYGPLVLDELTRLGVDTVLDYGCGKGHLGEWLFRSGFKGHYRPYDPAFPYWADRPEPAPFVACLDVLEHSEPELLGDILSDLVRCVRKAGLFVVHNRAAQKTLPDGRNAHLIVEPPAWWEKKIGKFFTITKSGTAAAEDDGDVLSTVLYVEKKR